MSLCSIIYFQKVLPFNLIHNNQQERQLFVHISMDLEQNPHIARLKKIKLYKKIQSLRLR